MPDSTPEVLSRQAGAIRSETPQPGDAAPEPLGAELPELPTPVPDREDIPAHEGGEMEPGPAHIPPLPSGGELPEERPRDGRAIRAHRREPSRTGRRATLATQRVGHMSRENLSAGHSWPRWHSRHLCSACLHLCAVACGALRIITRSTEGGGHGDTCTRDV